MGVKKAILVCSLILFACGGSPAVNSSATDAGTETADASVRYTAIAITAGSGIGCAITRDNTIECWGGNSNGQLGNGTTLDASVPLDGSLPASSSVPVTVTGIANAVAVSAGTNYACALLSDNSIRCWGDNSNGQLGNGTTIDSPVPVAVSGISNAKAVSTGYNHACAALNSGQVQCWGYNADGELGNGTSTDSSIPVAVTGISNAVAVTAGNTHSCAALNDGTVHCWGDNTYGELGNGSIQGSLTPVATSGISNATTVVSGYGYSCALMGDGTVQCWGVNGWGELGNGTTTYNPATVPVPVSGVASATAVTAGSFQACSLLSGGTVKCWGNDTDGELGDGNTADGPVSVPVPVSGITAATAVAAGANQTCALLASGSVQCWGYNGDGELGNGSTLLQSSVPVTVSGF